MSRIRKTLLKNGIKVITEHMPDVESTSVGVWIKNGSRDESPRERGITHFIEHLLFKGTSKRTAQDIASEIESVGGVLNAFTGREYTCFYAKVLNKDVPLAIDLLSDILINSTFDPLEIEKERMVVLQEIKMVDDTPDDLVHDLFASSLWKGHPLGSPVLGSARTVGSFGREDIIAYYRRHYHSKNVVITVAGGIRHGNVVKLIRSMFAGIEERNPSVATTAPVPLKGVKLVRRGLEQIHLCMGVPALYQAHPERYRLYLLNTILGGGMSSRLFQEIREKRGLAYSVYSYLSLMRDAGSLVVYAGTSREDFKRVTNLVIREMKRMRQGISSEEIRRAKEQLKGGMLLGLETSDSRMMKLARDEIYFGRTVPVKEIVEDIDSVRPRELSETASRILLPGRMTMVAIGRVKKDDLPAALRRKVV